MLDRFTNIGIIFNESHSESGDIACEIIDRFGIEYDCWKLNENEITKNSACINKADLLVAIGGDGTILRVAHESSKNSIPILGINTGRVGFMSELEANNVLDRVEWYFSGKARREYRFMLEAHVDGCDPMYALNDVTLARGKTLRVIEIFTEIDGVHLATYRCDGVVVSSATGSTGYALSLGGPVLDPKSDNMLLKPIATHMSQFGGAILTHDSTVTLRLAARSEATLNVDGFVDMDMVNSDHVKIKISDRKVIFLRRKSPQEFWGDLSKRLQLRKGTE